MRTKSAIVAVLDGLRRRSRRALLLALVVPGLAACGQGYGYPGGTTMPPSGAVVAASARPAQSPQQRARADAAAILASFVAPPAAQRLAREPRDGGSALGSPAMTTMSPNLVDAPGWWRVPAMAPAAVLAWEGSHLPRRFAQGGSGSDGRVSSTIWTLPAVPGVLYSRELTMSVVTDGAGGTYIRADAQVIWLPPRPASTFLPAGIRAVVVTAAPGMNDKAKPPAPVTVTDPARVRRLVALVNGLPMPPPVVFSCPMDDDRGVRLTFLSRAGGPVVAVALAKANGCGGVQLTIGRGRQVALGFGTDAAQQAVTISGLRWKLYGYLP